MDQQYITAQEVAQQMGVSQRTGYRIVKQLNSELKIDRLKQEAIREKGDATLEEVLKAQKDLSELEEVKSIRLLADDASPEALTTLLYQNSGKIAVISAEGGIFDIAAGRYSEKANIDVFLKSFSGDPILVDRKGRASESITDPALTMLLFAQPSVLQEIMKNRCVLYDEEFSRDHDGRGSFRRKTQARRNFCIGWMRSGKSSI